MGTTGPATLRKVSTAGDESPSCDNGDILSKANGSAGRHWSLILHPSRHSPGFILYFHSAQLDQVLSAPPPSGTVALGASINFLFSSLQSVLQVFPPWKQLLPQHPEIHVGAGFLGFFTLFL